MKVTGHRKLEQSQAMAADTIEWKLNTIVEPVGESLSWKSDSFGKWAEN